MREMIDKESQTQETKCKEGDWNVLPKDWNCHYDKAIYFNTIFIVNETSSHMSRLMKTEKKIEKSVFDLPFDAKK